MLLHALTIFAGAFLLFLVQPLIAKQILPWFGGSAAVWTTCLAFFQVMLLLGYAYAHGLTQWLKPRAQAAVHAGLLLVSLLCLPITARAAWQPQGGEEPGTRILGLLLVTIGLPYFLLAANGPLLQAWTVRTAPAAKVYRLFALSNLASLLALVSYPFAIEPWVTTHGQAIAWSVGYGAFALLCGGTALLALRRAVVPAVAENAPVPAGADAEVPPTRLQRELWVALPLMGTWLLVSITNHIQQNVAAVPFLWILPLSLYLLTFTLCFDRPAWYQRWVFVPLLGASLLAAAYILNGRKENGSESLDLALGISIAVPVYLAVLLIACMFLHGELAAARPGPRHLTSYYLSMAFGGAAGGLLVGLVAPLTLDLEYELGAGLALTAVVGAVVLWRRHWLLAVPALGVAAACLWWQRGHVLWERLGTVELTRSFYGTLRVEDAGDGDGSRRLVHGVILHGKQFLDPERRQEATTYYTASSGVGLAMQRLGKARRVGVIGLGTGSMAAWGEAGDVFRFYDINPQVIDIARRRFTFLGDTAAAVEIALGDARLSLEREEPQGFDVLVVDAFSSDAIPVHLITDAAMAAYLRHMKPDGVVAFHVTNRYLKLAPVVDQLARAAGLQAVLIDDDKAAYSSDWVLVSRPGVLDKDPVIGAAASPIEQLPGLRLWTDDYNNLLGILK